jgi:hypothetical protein
MAKESVEVRRKCGSKRVLASDERSESLRPEEIDARRPCGCKRVLTCV